MGTGRRVPGRAHSPVRDGGVASAIIDRRRERRPTRDRCGRPGDVAGFDFPVAAVINNIEFNDLDKVDAWMEARVKSA